MEDWKESHNLLSEIDLLVVEKAKKIGWKNFLKQK